MPEHLPANYLTHMNGFIATASADKRLKPAHISLYLTLFGIWNRYFFMNPFPISRIHVMQASHIGSKVTYIQALRDLHAFGYIRYYRSESIGAAPQISILPIKISPVAGSKMLPDRPGNDPAPGSEMAPFNKQIQKSNKENGAPPTKKQKKVTPEKPDMPEHPEDVVIFFQQMRFDPREAPRFFNHYEANGWHQSNGLPIRNWKAAAEKWVSNTPHFKIRNNASPNNRLSSGPSNYTDPL